ncbi:PREDICTED: synaptonemal complex protein 1-like [Camelina sativa]|uniref:Synaptonemal complex protein 1-like n=1 Tax=Camelina sativa TaxID=90675 RepID=A0ABM0T041_CAMSA|nr:PREDICTED: synaptonemal complex protein 1-like [Camelina sativa]
MTIKNEERMRVSIVEERSDLRDLTADAMKATYNTRKPGGVERCIDLLKHLKSLSLSVKDMEHSESIAKLEALKSHRNPKIRKEAQVLFHSWLKTIYTQGSDNSFQATLTKARLERKKPVLTRCSELKKTEDESSQTLEAVEIKKTIKLSELNKEDQRSLIRETEKIKKEARNDVLVLKQKEDHKSETWDEKYFKKDTKSDLKQLNMKRRRVALEDGKTKKPHEDIAYVPSSGSLTKKTTTEKELKNKKVDEMVKLFEAAKKAADVANTKGILSGKLEASRCIDALSLLMKINISPKTTEPRRMMEKLEGLTKHKDRKICHVASALLHLWRQRIREQDRKKSVTKTFPNNSREAC